MAIASTVNPNISSEAPVGNSGIQWARPLFESGKMWTAKKRVASPFTRGHSGQAPSAHSKFCAKMKGYGHQDSYSDTKVQALTLYSILKIAQKAKVPE